jgi:AhpD family alkylhydroperoxidase
MVRALTELSFEMSLPDDSTNPELAAEYAAARERTGRVMAILRALGPRAEVVRTFVAFTDAVLYGPAALSRREREVLAVETSRANGAAYSAEVHAGMLSGEGPRDRALGEFARRLTLTPEEDAVSLLRGQFSDAEISDAILTVALLNFANRAALATGISVADDLP